MKSQKSSRVDLLEKKIETLGVIAQNLLVEVNHLKTLSFGNSKIIKNMPDYEEALEKLKNENLQQMPEGKAKLEV